MVKVGLHLCAVIALSTCHFWGFCDVHVVLIEKVDYHTWTAFYRISSVDVSCWMNTVLTVLSAICSVTGVKTNQFQQTRLLLLQARLNCFASLFRIWPLLYLWCKLSPSLKLNEEKWVRWGHTQMKGKVTSYTNQLNSRKKDHLSPPSYLLISFWPPCYHRVTGLNRPDTATL